MRKRITLLVTALMLALTMSFGGAGAAFAKVGSSCDFERGTTTCTTVKGSHGEESEHKGQVNSSGKTTQEPTPCKVTGSDHTC